ncbi:hypothetical protein ACIPW5_26160 [Streptomyces sp. NPDC090077]|uniref:hypothetical protein n=1 Tax=Streptomyces sp. NPDC090077 TaxID=3365938 RepID=UPI00381AF5D1
MLGRTWRPLLGAVLASELAILIVVLITTLLMGQLLSPDVYGKRPNDLSEEDATVLILLLPFALLLYLVRGAMSAVACALIEQYRPGGPRVTVWSLLRAGVPRIPAAIGSDFLSTTLLMPLLLTTGTFIGIESPYVLLASAPLIPVVLFGVWLWVLLALAPAVAAFERVGAGQSMSRSGKLVKGAWWLSFATQGLAFLIAYGIGALAAMLVSVPGWNGEYTAFLPNDDSYRPSSLRFEAITDLYGTLALGTTLLIGFLMFQIAFTYLVNARLYLALRAREAA